MKHNAVWFKNVWLWPGSIALELFKEWKKESDPKSQKVARKKFEDHLKQVEDNYKKLCS